MLTKMLTVLAVFVNGIVNQSKIDENVDSFVPKSSTITSTLFLFPCENPCYQGGSQYFRPLRKKFQKIYEKSEPRLICRRLIGKR